jgi:hypothetical protein
MKKEILNLLLAAAAGVILGYSVFHRDAETEMEALISIVVGLGSFVGIIVGMSKKPQPRWYYTASVVFNLAFFYAKNPFCHWLGIAGLTITALSLCITLAREVMKER